MVLSRPGMCDPNWQCADLWTQTNSINRCFSTVDYFGPRFRFVAPLLSCVVFASLLGCGSDMVPAKGRVQYSDGSPLKGKLQVIRFEPDDKTSAIVRRLAEAPIKSDGSFEMSSIKPLDGVYKGQYVVTFIVLENQRTGKSLIPKKYTNFVESPFEIDVTGSKSDYLFELEKVN